MTMNLLEVNINCSVLIEIKTVLTVEDFYGFKGDC